MTATRTHVITGHRDEVHASLSRAYADGRLVSVTDGHVLAGERVRLVAQLREPTRTRPGVSWWPRVRPWLVVAAKILAALAVLAVMAGAVWLVVLAVLEVIAVVAAAIAWIQAHWLLIVLAGIGLLALVAGGGRCAGLHCGGCRR